MIKIAPSILAADFSRIGEEIRAVAAGGADWIHLDVMDGRFVPNLTVGPLVVEAAKQVTDLPLDVHLMIVEPDQLIPDFIKAGADFVTVHVEACPHLHRTLQLIKGLGAKAGVALNPATPVSAVADILDEIDLLLIMSVNPGFGGQKFIRKALDKIKIARKMIDDQRLSTELEVDGGVKVKNIRELSTAGVTTFVAGTSVFGVDDYETAITALKKEATI